MKNSKKKIIFVTGTRADYGKLKTIILKVQNNKKFTTNVFVTGMHNLKIYGSTWGELKKDGVKNIFRFDNQKNSKKMDIILSETIKGFSKYATKINPDLIVVHGDRIEPLACAIVGSLNNYRVAHIEGGEISGTVDELLRHSISKLSHLHFVCNQIAKKRLIQMGEKKENIYIIGSPNLDILLKKKLPNLSELRKRYSIKFRKFSLLVLHPVSTEIGSIKYYADTVVKSLILSKLNYVVILPNNDLGSDIIMKSFKKIKKNKKFRFLPSMKFEFYLSLLSNCDFIIGNSSSGIMEAPYLGVPTINLGSRQENRAKISSVNNLDFNQKKILKYIYNLRTNKKVYKIKNLYGIGNSSKKFLTILKNSKIWKIDSQKNFVDIKL